MSNTAKPGPGSFKGGVSHLVAATRGCYTPGNRDERKLAAAYVDRYVPDKAARLEVKMALFAATR